MVIPWKLENGEVFASETVVLSAVTELVEGTITLSGLTFLISILFVAP